MIIAERILSYGPEGAEQPIPIRIHAPEFGGKDWSCQFEIAWPQRTFSKRMYGFDATQALTITLEMIGLLLYSSDEHATGNLYWEQRDQGYGFPVPREDRNRLIGEDVGTFGNG